MSKTSTFVALCDGTTFHGTYCLRPNKKPLNALLASPNGHRTLCAGTKNPCPAENGAYSLSFKASEVASPKNGLNSSHLKERAYAPNWLGSPCTTQSPARRPDRPHRETGTKSSTGIPASVPVMKSRPCSLGTRTGALKN